MPTSKRLIENKNKKLLNSLILNIEDIKKFNGISNELDIIISNLIEISEENIYFLNNIYDSTLETDYEEIIKSITKTSIETRLIIEEINN